MFLALASVVTIFVAAAALVVGMLIIFIQEEFL